MIETDALVAIFRNWRSAVVGMVTFGLTIATSLTVGILAGFFVSFGLRFGQRMPTPEPAG
jgi:hypothetical protein